MWFAINQAPCPVSNLSVSVTVILNEGKNFEIDRSRKRHPVLFDIDFIFGRVEFNFHIVYTI